MNQIFVKPPEVQFWAIFSEFHSSPELLGLFLKNWASLLFLVYDENHANKWWANSEILRWEQMDGQMNRWTNRWTDRRDYKQLDEQRTDGRAEEQMDKQMNRWTSRWTSRWTDGRADEQIDEQTNRIKFTEHFRRQRCPTNRKTGEKWVKLVALKISLHFHEILEK